MRNQRARFVTVLPDGTGVQARRLLVADLKGKRVSTGVAAGVIELIVVQIFEAAGMDIDRDIQRERLVLADAVKAFQEGRIDAFFQTGYRVLSPILRDPAAFPGKKIKLVDTAGVVEAINRKYGPIYAKGAIPAGTYPGQDAAVPTLEDWTLLCAGQTVSEQVAYNVVKTLFEHKADLVAAYPDAADITLAKQAQCLMEVPTRRAVGHRSRMPPCPSFPSIFKPAERPPLDPSPSIGRWTRRAPGAATRIEPRLRGVTAAGIRLTQPVPSRPPNLEGLARRSLKAEIKRFRSSGGLR